MSGRQDIIKLVGRSGRRLGVQRLNEQLERAKKLPESTKSRNGVAGMEGLRGGEGEKRSSFESLTSSCKGQSDVIHTTALRHWQGSYHHVSGNAVVHGSRAVSDSSEISG